MPLELIPNNDLVFKGPFNAVSQTTLRLSNNGNDRLAYKIKTTAPKRYCVKPNSGYLEGHATANVQVMLQPQTPGQPDDRSKHKFMVQWVSVPSSYTEDVDAFWKQDLKSLNVQDSKLKCVFVDEQAAAVVPDDAHDHPRTDVTESTSVTDTRTQSSAPSSSSSTTAVTAAAPAPASVSNQQASPINTRTSNYVSSQSQDRQQGVSDNAGSIQQEIERLRNENASLKEKLDNTLKYRGKAGNSSVDQSKSTHQQQQQGGLVLFGITLTEQLVLVAFVVALLFGFSFGYFFFSCSN